MWEYMIYGEIKKYRVSLHVIRSRWSKEKENVGFLYNRQFTQTKVISILFLRLQHIVINSLAEHPKQQISINTKITTLKSVLTHN